MKIILFIKMIQLFNMTFSWYNLVKQIVKKEEDEFLEQNNVVIYSEKYFMQYRFILAGFNALIF